MLRRSTRALPTVLLLGACVSPESEPRRAPPPSAPTAAVMPSTPAEKHLARRVTDTTSGSLEHPARLATLFARLEELETRHAQADVRVVQLGDSHTASDYGTSVLRARLAARFGDGGRGFLPMGPPHLRLFQAGESVTRSSGFEPDGAPLLPSSKPPSGYFGLSGVAMETRYAGAFMISELSARADHFELAYLAQPGGGSFDVSIDGQRRERVATDGAARASAFRSLEVARGAHSLEVRAVGDGVVRIFGVRLDDDALGVTLDSLGMNGAKAATLLATDAPHFAEQLAHVSPSLVIVAYGTNEIGDSTTTADAHAEALRTLAERAQKGVSGAECLVLGPPDRDGPTPTGLHTLGKVAEILAAQRRAADDAGCAFYDQFAAMGGRDSIGRWSRESPPRARRDLVHLTRAGYATLAESLAADLFAAYESWKRERGSSR